MTIQAYAKVNLTLEVFGKRPDGFHALRSVVLPIGLADTLTFTPADEFSTDTGYADDLILKAAFALGREVGIRNEELGNMGELKSGKVEKWKRNKDNNSSTFQTFNSSTLQPYAIRVAKRIPAGGGLGGGSADAAATLLALNELWKLGKTPEELAAIGAQVGSDVPALVLANHYRAPVLMEGRGEVVSLLDEKVKGAIEQSEIAERSVGLREQRNDNSSTRHSSLVTHHFSIVLANLGVPCSTAAVYGKCRARVTDGDEILYTMRTALESQDIGRIAAAMMNDMQEPAVGICPEVGAALAAMREAGVAGAMMSGSGSTVFGLVPTEGEGRKIATLLNGRGLRAWSVAACPVV